MFIDSTLSALPSDREEAVREFAYHLQANRAKETVRFYRVQMKGVMRWAIENQIAFTAFGKWHRDRHLVYRKEGGTSPTTLHSDAL